jgi:uncharacterized protein
MAGKFVLQRSANGKYHFNLHAGNGEIIATSQLYETKASAEKGIESVRANAQGAALDDRCEQAVPKPAAPRPAAPKPTAPKPAAANPVPANPAGPKPAPPKPQAPAKA